MGSIEMWWLSYLHGKNEKYKNAAAAAMGSIET
jgi:hypothetical protein